METKSGLMENEAAKITQFYNLLTSSIDVIRTFCDRIPGIGELGAKDRDLLFQSACLELFTLRLAYRYDKLQGTPPPPPTKSFSGYFSAYLV